MTALACVHKYKAINLLKLGNTLFILYFHHIWNGIFTFSADCEVPKKMGMKASHTMQVVYMVKPMGLASLNVSGTPLVLIA